MSSTSVGNRAGWSNPTVDKAVADLRAAQTADAQRSAIKVIEDEYLKDAPFVVEAAEEEFVAASPKVHGLYATLETMVYLDKIWLDS